MENKKGRRNSILKTRVTVDVLSETVENNAANGPAQNRRVSFHNMKQIQEYDRHHGQMIDGTPIREKITDTLGSDGILTPRGGNMDNTNVLEHEGTFQVFNSAQTEHGAADMSLETTVNGGNGEEAENHNETARLFNVERDQTVYYEKVVETTKTTKTKITKIFGGAETSGRAAAGSADDTMSLFNQSNTELVDMSMDRVANDTMALFNQTNSEETDMELDQSSVSFAVPKMPRHHHRDKTLNRTMPMDLEEQEEKEKEEDHMKKANETINLFNVTNPDNSAMDISHHPIPSTPTRGPNDTISMFRSPAPQKKQQIFHDEMDITQDQIQEPQEMGSENMDISQAPPTPRSAPSTTPSAKKNATMAVFEQDDDMEITQNATINKPVETEKRDESHHMDISSVTVTGGQDVTHSATITLFENGATSPAKEKEVEVPPTVSASPAKTLHVESADETLKMFQSPARQSGNETTKMPASAQKTKIFADESMEIEESTIQQSPKSTEPEDPESAGSPESKETNESSIHDPESIQKTLEESSMMLENSVLEEERAAVLQNSMMEVREEQEEEKLEEKDAVDPGFIQKTSSSFRREELMEEDSMDISMDISRQNTPQRSMHHRPKSVQDASTIQNENEATANPMEEEPAKNPDESMVKTMQISTDTADVTRTIQEEEEETDRMDLEEEEETLKNNESERKLQDTLQMFNTKLHVVSTESREDVTIQTSAAPEESTIHVAREESTILGDGQNLMQSTFHEEESYSIRNTSRRRRSLLRDPSVRESPRRMALENSMHISMNMPNHHGRGEDGRMTALAEYRQNKSVLNASQQEMMNESGMNVTAASSGTNNGTRDIFAMNTSIRSPRNAIINKSINLNTPRVPSPISMDNSVIVPPSPGFPMPIYDPAVVNVLYLTSDDGTAHPEAADFQKLMKAEKEQLEERKEIQNSEDVAYYPNLTKQDHRDVMLLAREEAEIQFLELRLKFATEHSQRQTRSIEHLTSENSKMAEQIRDAQNLPEIKNQIEKLKVEKTRYTKAEVRQIRKEYKEWRQKMFDAQMAALKHNYEVALTIVDERAELRMEMEEMEERYARIEEKNRKERRALVEQIAKIIEE